jgi:DNA-binding NarL/FixJ family response regulator
MEVYRVQAYVIILSGYSLFAEGVANRLREYLKQVEIKVINPQHPDAMPQIIAAQPSFVVLDITDPEVTRLCPFSKLLFLLPKLKIIGLNPQREKAQVVTCEQRQAVNVLDLVEVIEQFI